MPKHPDYKVVALVNGTLALRRWWEVPCDPGQCRARRGEGWCHFLHEHQNEKVRFAGTWQECSQMMAEGSVVHRVFCRRTGAEVSRLTVRELTEVLPDDGCQNRGQKRSWDQMEGASLDGWSEEWTEEDETLERDLCRWFRGRRHGTGETEMVQWFRDYKPLLPFGCEQ